MNVFNKSEDTIEVMRRSKQQVPQEEALHTLSTATSGVLSLVDVDARPYGVPMSFVYDGQHQSIYFHCALSGRKIDSIRNNPHSCFTIIDQDEIHPDEFTTYFKSVIAEGTITILQDKEQMIEGLRLLSKKYSPGIDCGSEIGKSIDRVLVLKMQIESITGKEAIELTRKRM